MDKGTLRSLTPRLPEYNGDLAEAYRQPLRDGGLPVDDGAVQLFLKEHGFRPPSPVEYSTESTRDSVSPEVSYPSTTQRTQTPIQAANPDAYAGWGSHPDILRHLGIAP
jgi:hypothetical protein